jgi:hypothetical protein
MNYLLDDSAKSRFSGQVSFIARGLVALARYGENPSSLVLENNASPIARIRMMEPKIATELFLLENTSCIESFPARVLGTSLRIMGCYRTSGVPVTYRAKLPRNGAYGIPGSHSNDK